MNQYENSAFFWQKLDTLYLSSGYQLVKRKGEVHDKFKNLVYPLDYGRVDDLSGSGSKGNAVYLGSLNRNKVSGLIIAVDILAKELDVKVLAGCTDEEIESVLRYLNQTDFQKTVLIRRGNEVPAWSITE